MIDGAEARAIGLEGFRDGSPQPSDGVGALIVTEKSTMVRAIPEPLQPNRSRFCTIDHENTSILEAR